MALSYLAMMMLEESLQRRCPGILAVGLAKNSWACHESIAHPPVFVGRKRQRWQSEITTRAFADFERSNLYKHPSMESSVYRSNTRPSGPRFYVFGTQLLFDDIRWVAPKRIGHAWNSLGLWHPVAQAVVPWR